MWHSDFSLKVDLFARQSGTYQRSFDYVPYCYSVHEEHCYIILYTSLLSLNYDQPRGFVETHETLHNEDRRHDKNLESSREIFSIFEVKPSGVRTTDKPMVEFEF